LLAKYGGEKHLSVPEEIKAQTISTAEESLIKEMNDPRLVNNKNFRLREGLVGIQSKYTENEVTDGHSSIWGSAYDRVTGKWGY
jgi:hypothetical protein